MRHLKVPLFLIASLLLATALAPSPAVEAQAQGIVGWTGHVEVEGDVLYVHTIVEGDRSQPFWKVYDISDALAPVQIGELPGFAAIKVEGDLAYGTTIQSDGTRHIAIVDVSDPANPRFLDQSLVVPHGTYWWFGHGQVYLTETGYGGAEWLHIYRLDDDGHPQFMSTYTVKEPELSVEPSATGESMDDSTIMALDWPYLYYKGGGPIDVSDPENPVATSLGGVPRRSNGAWSVKDRIGYGQMGPYHYECGPRLVITDTKGRWEEYYVAFDVFELGDAPASSFEMAWNTYLMVGSTGGFASYECPGAPHFEILDFSRFSFATGEGSISIIYHDELPVQDSAYHEGEGVIYVSRGDGGLDIMQAPFPTLNRQTYFPLAAW